MTTKRIIGASDPNGKVSTYPNDTFVDISQHIEYIQKTIPSGTQWEVKERNVYIDINAISTAASATAIWGGIGGLLANQTDLMAALNAKQDIAGLGSMAFQASTAVAITGGTVNGATIGATTQASGKFTSLTTTSVSADKIVYTGTGGLLTGLASAASYQHLRRNAANTGYEFSSSGVFSSVTNTGLTATRIPYVTTGGLIADSANIIWDNTNSRLIVSTGGISIKTTSTASNLALLLAPTNTTSQEQQYIHFATAVGGGVNTNYIGVDSSSNLYIKSYANYTTFLSNRVYVGGLASSSTLGNIMINQTQPMANLILGTVTGTGTGFFAFYDQRTLNVSGSAQASTGVSIVPTLTNIGNIGFSAFNTILNYSSSSGSQYLKVFNSELTLNLTGTNTTEVTVLGAKPTFTAITNYRYTFAKVDLGTSTQYGYRQLGVNGLNDFEGTVDIKGRFVVPGYSAAPSAPLTREIYFDTSLSKLRFFDGAAWNNLY